MALTLLTIPCLSDNYAYLLHDPATGDTALIDAPEAGPILAALDARGWPLGQILITHHHADHIQAVPELVEKTGARVLGAQADAHRLPPLDRALNPGDRVLVGGAEGSVLDVPGHTVGHIAFVFHGENLAFTADSLMSGGCGRLFEGSADQMWASLQSLAALPDDTLICSGHEYTASNLRFAASVDGQNPALRARIEQVARDRAAGLPTVPVPLGVERATNPFLRAPHLKAALGLPPDAPDAQAFAHLRAAKDQF